MTFRRLRIPRLVPLPPEATPEQHEQTMNAYIDELVALNRWRFLPLGVRRRWWHFGKREHPRTWGNE